jgi:hypothetical protein
MKAESPPAASQVRNVCVFCSGSLEMKIQWCWRCRKDVPMFDEEEYEVISRLYSDGLEASKRFMQQHKVSADKIPLDKLYLPLIDMHEKMTGVRETNQEEIRKHRITDFGPLCQKCGKVLRSSKAVKCYECGRVAH